MEERLVQDGGVEGPVLTFSHQSTKTATSCWTTIERMTLEPTKKRYPTPKDKGEAATKWTATGLGKKRLHSFKVQTKPCAHQDPGKRNSSPTGDWARPTCECLRVSFWGTGQQRPAMGKGALVAEVLGDESQSKSFWRSPVALPQSL